MGVLCESESDAVELEVVTVGTHHEALCLAEDGLFSVIWWRCQAGRPARAALCGGLKAARLGAL